MQQRDRAVEVVHILADGSLETHEQSVGRLVQMTGLANSAAQSPATYPELVAQALALQEKRVGYCVRAPNAWGRKDPGAQRPKSGKTWEQKGLRAERPSSGKLAGKGEV